LVAVAGGGAAGRAVVPALRFRLEVSGDEEFFTPEPRHAGRLLLPALPPLVVERFEPGPSWIDLRLDQAPDEAVVTLHVPDARGGGAEVQFEVEATDPDGCEASTRASLREP